MSCLVKRGNRWTARIYVEGQERWRSLGTGDRQEAARKARLLEESLKGSQWVKRQLDSLLVRAEKDTQPEEAGLVCESVAQGLCRLLLMVPEVDRNRVRLTLTQKLSETQNTKLSVADGWKVWLASSNRSNPKERTLKG